MAQIGTVRLETQNSGVVDVPVFEPGDSASGIYEFVRVETASGPGFIPVTDPVDATYPYLRVQSQNNGIVAVTDTPGSDIPDSAIYYFPYGERNDTTVNELEQNDNGTSNGTTNVSGTWIDGFAESGDGTDSFIDIGTLPQFFPNNLDQFSIRLTIQTSASGTTAFFGADDGSNQLSLYGNISSGIDISSGDTALLMTGPNGGRIDFGTAGNTNITDGNKHRLVFVCNSFQNRDFNLGIDGGFTSDLAVDDRGVSLSEFTDLSQPVYSHARNNNGTAENYLNGIIDEVVIDNKGLSSAEIQDDYNRQPWS